jgi:hypothetical protein
MITRPVYEVLSFDNFVQHVRYVEFLKTFPPGEAEKFMQEHQKNNTHFYITGIGWVQSVQCYMNNTPINHPEAGLKVEVPSLLKSSNGRLHCE